MVLRNQDRVLCAGRLNGTHPLLGIELSRSEQFWVGSTVSPLAIQEGVGAEMNDDAKLEVLPCDLLGRGFHVNEVLQLCADVETTANGDANQQQERSATS